MNVKRVFGAFAAGLAAAATTTALAADNEYIWSNATGNQLWSDAGNWLIDNDPKEVATNPPDLNSIVYFADNGTYPADMVVDADSTIGNLVCWSSGEQYRRFSGGHTLTVLGTISSSAVFNRVGLIEVSGAGTQLLLSDTTDDKYTFRESSTMVTNNAKLVVKGKPFVRSTNSNGVQTTPVGFTAIDGGIYEFAKFNLRKDKNSSKAVKSNINLAERGVMKITGECSIGDNYNVTAMSISGEKPEGGFLQVGGALTLHSGLTLSIKPELAWADGSDVGIIAHSGTDSATLNANVAYKVDLKAFQDMAAHTTNTICIFSNPNGSGTTSFNASKFTYTNKAADITATPRTAGKNLYLDISRGHVFGDWEITRMPTKKQAGKKTCRCTDAGCNHAEDHDLPVLPGDYLQLDTVGWFETAYVPHLKNTTIDFVTSSSTNVHGRSLAMAGDSNFWFIFVDVKQSTGKQTGFAGYCTDSTGKAQENFADYAGKEPRMAYTFGGGKITVDGVTTTVTDDPKDDYADSAMTLFKYTPYQLTAGVRVYSIKVTEKVGDEDVVKMWLVPGTNGTQATLFDLASETYLTPKCDKGKTVKFAIGDDPVTGFKMYVR